SALGGSQVPREGEPGTLISVGDALKAAATDAMKKCAPFLGVGLHLYAEKPLPGRGPGARGPAAPAQPAAAPRPPARTSTNGTRPAPGGQSGNGHGPGSITSRQLDAIWKVGRAKGLDPEAVGHMSLRVFNRKPDALTREEASKLIKGLSNLKRRGA